MCGGCFVQVPKLIKRFFILVEKLIKSCRLVGPNLKVYIMMPHWSRQSWSTLLFLPFVRDYLGLNGPPIDDP